MCLFDFYLRVGIGIDDNDSLAFDFVCVLVNVFISVTTKNLDCVICCVLSLCCVTTVFDPYLYVRSY